MALRSDSSRWREAVDRVVDQCYIAEVFGPLAEQRTGCERFSRAADPAAVQRDRAGLPAGLTLEEGSGYRSLAVTAKLEKRELFAAITAKLLRTAAGAHTPCAGASARSGEHA